MTVEKLQINYKAQK